MVLYDIQHNCFIELKSNYGQFIDHDMVSQNNKAF
jgi:hypothetical protein